MKIFWSFRSCLVLFGVTMISSPVLAVFLDGQGHYGFRGQTRTSPGFMGDTGTYQAILQTFRLEGEARINEPTSVFMELSIFDDPRAAFLGDKPEPRRCAPRRSDPEPDKSVDIDTTCVGRHQDTGEPHYQDLAPRLRKAYIRHAFDYCLIEAGRRGRDWGLGIFLDSGSDPFDTDASVFDGVTCKVNIQKAQTLGFSFGWDRLSETGTCPDNPYDNAVADAGTPGADGKTGDQRNYSERCGRTYGATNIADDLDQIFFTIELDDRKANAGTSFAKHVAIYAANVIGRRAVSPTDIKFLDLYLGLYFSDFTLRNEFLFRLGKSADPSWAGFGGRSNPDEMTTNRLQSIGFAGSAEWTLARSGASIWPAPYRQGSATRHSLFAEYAYAPGDSDGFLTGLDRSTDINGVPKNEDFRALRDTKATAMAFHRNFKPALLFFNSHAGLDHTRVDGVYDPDRVMNAFIYGLGYRYESLSSGNFESKLLTGRLNETATTPEELIAPAASASERFNDARARPVGYYSSELGYELDLKYDYYFQNNVSLNVAGAIGLPGKAWKQRERGAPATAYLTQAGVTFTF